MSPSMRSAWVGAEMYVHFPWPRVPGSGGQGIDDRSYGSTSENSAMSNHGLFGAVGPRTHRDHDLT